MFSVINGEYIENTRAAILSRLHLAAIRFVLRKCICVIKIRSTAENFENGQKESGKMLGNDSGGKRKNIDGGACTWMVKVYTHSAG